MAGAVLVALWLVLLFTKRKHFILFSLKHITVLQFANFQHTKLDSFQNLSVGFILKIFLKFIFVITYSYKRKIECSQTGNLQNDQPTY